MSEEYIKELEQLIESEIDFLWEAGLTNHHERFKEKYERIQRDEKYRQHYPEAKG